MATHERPNRASPKEAASFIDRADELERDREERLRELDAEFKAKKRAVNKEVDEDQAEILEDAKGQGVNKGVIRALMNERKDLRKAALIQERAAGRLEGLEDDEREFAVDIRTALGTNFAGLPLGQAAVEREESGKPDKTTSAVVDAVRKSMTDKEWDEAARGASH